MKKTLLATFVMSFAVHFSLLAQAAPSNVKAKEAVIINGATIKKDGAATEKTNTTVNKVEVKVVAADSIAEKKVEEVKSTTPKTSDIKTTQKVTITPDNKKAGKTLAK